MTADSFRHMKLGGVILDMDGLMLDTEPLYKAAWQQAASELGYGLDDASYLRLAGRRTEDCERELEQLFGSAFPMPRFRARWPILWKTRAHEGIATKAGLVGIPGVR